MLRSYRFVSLTSKLSPSHVKTVLVSLMCTTRVALQVSKGVHTWCEVSRYIICYIILLRHVSEMT